jgi:hypothetical protein
MSYLLIRFHSDSMCLTCRVLDGVPDIYRPQLLLHIQDRMNELVIELYTHTFISGESDVIIINRSLTMSMYISILVMLSLVTLFDVFV